MFLYPIQPLIPWTLYHWYHYDLDLLAIFFEYLVPYYIIKTFMTLWNIWTLIHFSSFPTIIPWSTSPPFPPLFLDPLLLLSLHYSLIRFFSFPSIIHWSTFPPSPPLFLDPLFLPLHYSLIRFSFFPTSIPWSTFPPSPPLFLDPLPFTPVHSIIHWSTSPPSPPLFLDPLLLPPLFLDPLLLPPLHYSLIHFSSLSSIIRVQVLLSTPSSDYVR